MNYDKILGQVEKSSRYIGGEINSVYKDISEDTIRYCFAFPDSYEVGMSYMGLHILYYLMNDIEDVYCERVFAPWRDMEEKLRENKIALSSLETFTPLNEFDILGFTLQYELSYTNILNMMNMANIPLRSSERSEKEPLIVAGGPCAFNPEPIAHIVDVVFIGESEENYIEFFDVYRKYKKSDMTKKELLLELSKIEGIYIPSFYDVAYKEDGTIEKFYPIEEGVPETVNKRIINDFDKAFKIDRMLVPFTDIVHDRATIEVFRGCTKGCRFCQAGMIYRPVRERSEETIIQMANDILKNTGYEEVGLASLSTLDHSQIDSIIPKLLKEHEDNKIGVSLPSLRMDSQSIDILEEVQKVRKSGLTFAPEAGSQRMRDVINKGIDEENIESTFVNIFSKGWSRVKLYFMIGLPTETLEDVADINEVSNTAIRSFRLNRPEWQKQNLRVTVSTSCFVPKPFTPFQWMAQDDVDTFYKKIDHLKNEIVSKKVVYNYHDPHTSYLEAVFARGDRKLNDVLLKAYELGCKFDGWNEYFDFAKWQQAFDACGVDMDFYALRERSFDEVFPWDFINSGVTKEYLIEEYTKAINAEVTQDCREGCTNCGVNVQIVGGPC